MNTTMKSLDPNVPSGGHRPSPEQRGSYYQSKLACICLLDASQFLVCLLFCPDQLIPPGYNEVSQHRARSARSCCSQLVRWGAGRVQPFVILLTLCSYSLALAILTFPVLIP